MTDTASSNFQLPTSKNILRFFRLQREVLPLDGYIQRLGTADVPIRREHLAIIPRKSDEPILLNSFPPSKLKCVAAAVFE